MDEILVWQRRDTELTLAHTAAKGGQGAGQMFDRAPGAEILFIIGVVVPYPHTLWR